MCWQPLQSMSTSQRENECCAKFVAVFLEFWKVITLNVNAVDDNFLRTVAILIPEKEYGPLEYIFCSEMKV